MNTKDRLKNELIIEMQPILTQEQMDMLVKAINKALYSVEIVQMETMPATEENTNEYLIKLYLARAGSRRSKNTVEQTEPLKEVRKPIDFLSGMELEELREGCETARDRAIIEFLRSTGARIGEAVLVNRSDINRESGDITVFAPKTGEYRVVFLDEEARYHVGKYLQTRTDDNDSLFVSSNSLHTTLTEDGIRYCIRKIKERSGLDRRVYPHLMRKTLATTLNKHNCQPQRIQQILGHSNINTTMRYYAATSVDQLRLSHNQCA